MAILQGWMPPTRENWETVCVVWQLFPVVSSLLSAGDAVADGIGCQITAFQWVLDWYGQGKTSTKSRFNLPGRWAWATMETPGLLTLLYIMYTLPRQLAISELPWGNWTMAGCYVRLLRAETCSLTALETIHYLYRALLAPLMLNLSMSPIHPLVWLLAVFFQLSNATCIGGWLAGYGPTTDRDWAGRLYWMECGLVVFGWGLLANMFHDDDLREIRRAADRRQRREAAATGKPVAGVDKVYMMPKNGLFRYVLYAHYLCEWVEWAGFWMVGGWQCWPARTFLVNEMATMVPRALQGKRWYVARFGEEQVGRRKAVIPGLL